MAKINKDLVAAWTKRCSELLGSNIPPLSVADVNKGVDAWTVAHRAGIVVEAYKDPTVHDAHIRTALEQIFPNAVFRDKKVY